MTTATFVTTMGSFTVRLMPEHAPKTVANFVGLARGGWNINDRLGRVAAPADGVTLDGWRLRGPHLQPTSHLSVDVEPFEGSRRRGDGRGIPHGTTSTDPLDNAYGCRRIVGF